MSSSLHSTTGAGTDRRTKHAGDADADAIIEAINRPKQYEPDQIRRVEAPDGQVKEKTVSDMKDRWLPRMDLPGFGELGDTCGEDIHRFCECCGDSWTVGETCRRSTCPRCSETWCREAATSIAAKLKACWATMWKSSNEHPYFHHLVIDIPDDWQLAGDPDTVYHRTLDVIKEILDEFGISGVPIYHPYRGDSETADDRGEWSDRQFSGRSWDDVSDELEFDPHFHVVGIAPFIDCTGVEKIQSETGWPIHRITKAEDSNVSIGNDYDMAGVVAYCLSHAGVYEDTNGDMSAAAHTRIAERPWRKDGFMNGTIPTIQDRTRKQMDEIVRSVAPRVLGTDYNSVACLREVPADAAADGDLSLDAGSAEYVGTGEGDGTSSADEPADDEGEVRLVKCEGRALHIQKAREYLNDSTWRETADYAVSLEQTYEDWRRERGIV